MKLSHINKIYHNQNNDVHALKDIQLEIHEVGMTFILGPSGSGKSTLSRIMNGEDHDYQGTVENLGVVEFIEQDICLFENMSVLENLLLVSSRRDVIDNYLKQFDMEQYQNKKVSHLSGGQKKRVQIIRSLLIPFDYLLCDEPTAGLDKENTEVIMKVLKSISQTHSVIIITHEQTLEEKYSDHTIWLRNGKIENDVIKHEVKQIESETVVYEKPNHFSFFGHYLKASFSQVFTKFISITILVFALFLMTSFFTSIDGEVKNLQNWKNTNNLLISQPTDTKTQMGDLYDSETVKKVQDNVSSVIGYKRGWKVDYISPETLVPPMTLADVKDAVKKEDEQYEKDGIPHSEDYQHFLEIIKESEAYKKATGKERDETAYAASDGRAYEAFSRNEDGSYRIPYIEYCSLGEYLERVDIYQLYDMKALDLEYGNYPQKDNEILLSHNVAEDLCKQYQLSSIEDVIGQNYDIDIENEMLSVNVTGISYVESQDCHYIFFQDGSFDKFLYQFYGMKSNDIKYEYVNFLIDGKADAKTESQNIETVLGSQKSQFVAYPESVLNTGVKHETTNSTTFYVMIIAMTIVVVLVYAVILILQKKRYSKEVKILKQYHYSLQQYILLPVALEFGIDLILYGVSFTKLCDFVNGIARQQGYSELISGSLFIFVVSFVVAMIIVLCLEGIFYVSQTRKHHQKV